MANNPISKGKYERVKSIVVPVKLLTCVKELLDMSIVHIQNEDVSNMSYMDLILQENLLSGEYGLCAMHDLLNLQIDLGVKYAKH